MSDLVPRLFQSVQVQDPECPVYGTFKVDAIRGRRFIWRWLGFRAYGKVFDIHLPFRLSVLSDSIVRKTS